MTRPNPDLSPTAIGAGRFKGSGGVVHTVLRIGAGLLFMQHGAQKLLGWLGGFGPGGGTVELASQMGVAGVLELFGGLLMVLGLLARPVAAVLVVEMIWAYVQMHMPRGGAPIQNGGEPALLFALIWAYFAATGAGPVSADRLLERRRSL
jgi:putative oxidoreductase